MHLSIIIHCQSHVPNRDSRFNFLKLWLSGVPLPHTVARQRAPSAEGSSAAAHPNPAETATMARGRKRVRKWRQGYARVSSSRAVVSAAPVDTGKNALYPLDIAAK